MVGTLLTGLLVWGSLLPYSLWLPIKGPGRAPLALKGAHAPFILTCPLHCTGSSSRCGQDAPNQPVSHRVRLTPTFLLSPPCLVPALGWAAPLGHRKEGRRGLSPLPRLLSLKASRFPFPQMGHQGASLAYLHPLRLPIPQGSGSIFSSVHKLPLDSCVVFCSTFHS